MGGKKKIGGAFSPAPPLATRLKSSIVKQIELKRRRSELHVLEDLARSRKAKVEAQAKAAKAKAKAEAEAAAAAAAAAVEEEDFG